MIAQGLTLLVFLTGVSVSWDYRAKIKQWIGLD